MKNVAIIILLTVAVIGAFIFWALEQPKYNTSSPLGNENEIIYYYGEGCQHCKNVSDFFEENEIEKKVIFQKKEVWSDRKNGIEMENKAKQCNIKPSGMGVPFLYARGNCYIGEVEVIDFFKKEAGIE